MTLIVQGIIYHLLWRSLQSTRTALPLEAYLFVSVNINQLKLVGLKPCSTLLFGASRQAVAIVQV